MGSIETKYRYHLGWPNLSVTKLFMGSVQVIYRYDSLSKLVALLVIYYKFKILFFMDQMSNIIRIDHL